MVARAPDSPSASLDVKPGDVIHELNHMPISSLDAFREGLKRFHREDAVALQIERHGRLAVPGI